MRLPQVADREAWEEFVSVYEPFIYSFARRRGLDDSEAQDTVQRVMIAVLKSVERWKPEANGPKFRNWLFTIARNQVLNSQLRSRRNAACGGTTSLDILNSIPDPGSSQTDALEFRREVILFAASRIRKHVEPVTWEAFWRTAVLGESAQSVAIELEIGIASVYAARSRVTSRLREQVGLMTEVQDELPRD